MGRIRLDGKFEVSAEALWDVVSDFGNVFWLPGDPDFESEGEGPGMIRTIRVGKATPVREQLKECDAEERAIHYTIVEGSPLPVRDYLATMKVVALKEGGSRLEWSSTWDPEGVSEEQAQATIKGVYEVVLHAMKAKVEKR